MTKYASSPNNQYEECRKSYAGVKRLLKNEPKKDKVSGGGFESVCMKINMHPEFKGYWLCAAGKEYSNYLWVLFSKYQHGRVSSFKDAVLVDRGSAMLLGFKGCSLEFFLLPPLSIDDYYDDGAVDV